jgi:hypothetical protein
MPKQQSYNTHYSQNNVMEPLLSAIVPDGQKLQSRWLSAHLDNCRVHGSIPHENCFTENEIVQVPHLAYSRDLAPSDLWLFGHMKGARARQQFTRPADPLDDIPAFQDEIQRSKLERILHHWIEPV